MLTGSTSISRPPVGLISLTMPDMFFHKYLHTEKQMRKVLVENPDQICSALMCSDGKITLLLAIKDYVT